MLTPPFYQTPSLSARRFDWGLCCDVLYSVERPGDACGGDGPDEDLGGRDAAVEFDLAVPFVPAEGPHHATAAANQPCQECVRIYSIFKKLSENEPRT